MIKKWILKTDEADCAESRAPKPGEYYLGSYGSTAYKAPESPLISEKCVILHPVPDDVAMVPRERIESLLKRVRAIPIGAEFAHHGADINEVLNAARLLCGDAIPEPTDEILEALKDSEAIVVGECNLPRTVDRIQNAIALREKELKERQDSNAMPCLQEDTITEALKRVVEIESPGSIHHHLATLSLRMREQELKERGE